MGPMRLCVCVCLSVLFVTVTGQRIRRPQVQAGRVVDDDMNAIKSECNRRYSINNTIAHYVRVPNDCSAFAMCDNHGRDPSVMLCGSGLFFNDDMGVQTCVRPVHSNCQGTRGDYCVGKPDGYFQDMVRSQEFQAAYIICQGGMTMGGNWCELGEQYLAPEQPCFAIPDRPVPRPPTEAPIECHLRAVPGNNRMFMLGRSETMCPLGLVFSQSGCGCEWPW